MTAAFGYVVSMTETQHYPGQGTPKDSVFCRDRAARGTEVDAMLAMNPAQDLNQFLQSPAQLHGPAFIPHLTYVKAKSQKSSNWPEVTVS